ncbi:MAG: purine nucleoside phosphorylase [Desulfobacterales bacterium SG8_35_2]|nr:MAG: purine nucleoside phosphorylase [Desulfobacterales bacterium SG8_35_2]
MLDMNNYKRKVDETLSFLQHQIKTCPSVVIILGTGLGSLIDSIEVDTLLPYNKIPHFPRPTVPGHQGNLVFGTLNSRVVAVLQGRFHYYEGYSTRELTLPLRALSLLGADTLVVTNAAGGLDPDYRSGTIMVIRDHLNFIGENPLRGPNIDDWGPRFPDLSEPYDKKLIDTTLQCAEKLHMDNVTTGVYVAIPGPSLETPAETRFLRNAGADAVGMSSVPEVIVARHAAMKVLGLSAVANVNDPDNFAPILLDDIIRAAAAIEPALQQLIVEVLKIL